MIPWHREKKNYWLTLFLFKKFTINKINKKLSANCVESRARFQHTKRQGKVKNFQKASVNFQQQNHNPILIF